MHEKLESLLSLFLIRLYCSGESFQADSVWGGVHGWGWGWKWVSGHDITFHFWCRSRCWERGTDGSVNAWTGVPGVTKRLNDRNPPHAKAHGTIRPITPIGSNQNWRNISAQLKFSPIAILTALYNFLKHSSSHLWLLNLDHLLWHWNVQIFTCTRSKMRTAYTCVALNKKGWGLLGILLMSVLGNSKIWF
jgi:hypothetical protein